MKKLIIPAAWLVVWSLLFYWAYTKPGTETYMLVLYGVLLGVSVVRLVIAIRNYNNDRNSDNIQQ